MDTLTPAELQLLDCIVDHAVDGVAENLMLTVRDLEWDYGMAYRYMLRLARREAIVCQNRGRGRYRPIRMYVRSE